MALTRKRAKLSLSTSVTLSSTEASDFNFDPCDHCGDHVAAKSYCKNCQEFLCLHCTKSHLKATLSRTHILLEGDKLPTKGQKPFKSKTECTELCPQHPQEVIIYYCRTHDDVGCHVCMEDNHSVCENKFIPDIFEDAGNDTECQNFIKDLEDIGEQAEHYKKQRLENKEKVDKYYDTAIKQMKSFRNDINSRLDQMETSVTSDATKIKQDIQSEMDRIISECDRMSSDTEELKAEIQKKENDKSKTFVLMKLNKDKVRSYKTSLGADRDVDKIKTFMFEPNKALQRDQSFGQISIKPEIDTVNKGKSFDIVATASTCVSVKSASDTYCCNINGITVVSSDEIAVADYGNKTVKFIDVRENKVISELAFPTKPFDVTMVTPETLAVTLPASLEIQMFTKSDIWKVDNHIEVKGNCYGITKCSDGNMAVSFESPPKVEILKRNGVVLKTFQVDSNGKNMFMKPERLAVDSDDKYVYVSDKYMENVTKLSLATGEVCAVYESSSKHPGGVAVTENGTVLVCDLIESNSNVYMFSDDFSNFEILLSKNVGLISPKAICYCSWQRKLYVVCHNHRVINNIFIFTVQDK